VDRRDKTPAFLVLLAGLVAAVEVAVQVLLPALLPVLAIPQVHHHHRGILVVAEHRAVERPTMVLEVVEVQAL
jgi:hypothetical protein